MKDSLTVNFVARPGFEPRPSEPESEILPLYYRAMRCKCREILLIIQSSQQYFFHFKNIFSSESFKRNLGIDYCTYLELITRLG